MRPPLRVLLLADTHLGFDLPARPRVRRRRRGHDFQANYEAALAPALGGEVDLVVHGGDLFHRSRVPPSLAYQGLEPLVRVADAGVPVALVPGNHERSRIPHSRFGRHPGVHLFDRPRVIALEIRGVRVALAGFPSERREVRHRFPELIRRTGWRPGRAEVDLLCVHQAFEGAVVGPSDFMFTTGADVVRAADVPAGLTAVLSGHIHRHQVLTRDLRGERLSAPILYPGSVERTSLAEKDEPKGYLVVEVEPARSAEGEREAEGGRPRWQFRRLPARPMVVRDLEIDGVSAAALDAAVRGIVREAPPDAVLRVRTRGEPSSPAAARVLTAAHVRRFTPTTVNLEIRAPGPPPRRSRRPSRREPVQRALEL